MNPSAGKHASTAGSDSDVPITRVLLNRSKGHSFAIAIGHESVSQTNAAKRIFRNAMGARVCEDVVSCSGGWERGVGRGEERALYARW